MSPRLETSMTLDRPREDVFAFFADAGNLERLTPPELRFQILSPPVAMRKGTLIEYRLQLFGVPFGWRSLISRWEPPECFVDVQVKGPYRRWIHTHLFRETAAGTEILDRVEYQLPLWPLSEPVKLMVARQLERIFAYRQQALETIFSESGTTD